MKGTELVNKKAIKTISELTDDEMFNLIIELDGMTEDLAVYVIKKVNKLLTQMKGEE